jgi:APA family basic amino acid/polyamine antiporter
MANMSEPFERHLSLLDSVSIVVGLMVGGGIFLVPNLIARDVWSAPAIMSAWAIAGAISLTGALAYAELTAAFPRSGGQYVFLREAYGPMTAFVCGWSFFTVSRSSQIAWLAGAVAIYLSYLTPLSGFGSKAISICVLAAFTWANYRGARLSAGIQNGFAAAKTLALLFLCAGAFTRHPVSPSPFTSSHVVSLGGFGAAVFMCQLCYDGWAHLSFVAGEIRHPERAILRALAVGVLAVTGIYLFANAAYLRVMSVADIANSQYVAATASARVFGPAGGKIASIMVLISILGALNGCLFTAPRVYFAQASDGLFFAQFARIHSKYGTPSFAVMAQGVWAAILLLSGSYDLLIDFTLLGLWLFYGLTVAAVIILRRTHPDINRPYRMTGYPITPLIFLVASGWFIWNLLVTQTLPALAGLSLTVTGIPAYAIWRILAKKSDLVRLA